MPSNHYENFPVASFLLPKHLHEPVKAIYRFARSADDIADEGNFTSTERLKKLENYQEALADIKNKKKVNPELRHIFDGIAIQHKLIGLPLEPCNNLLSAFIQDIHKHRYANYSELLEYCNLSANPVGRLLLFLFNAQTEINCQQSDLICTALQLTNHLQDIFIDATKSSEGRIYLPQDEMQIWGLTDLDIISGSAIQKDPVIWTNFMKFQTNRVMALFNQGQELPSHLSKNSWRIGQELRLTIAGGRRILKKINSVNGNVLNQRPTLNFWDWLSLLILGHMQA